MKKLLFLLFVLIICSKTTLVAQFTKTGPGLFSSNFYGPTYTNIGKNRMNRHCYIYAKSVLGNLQNNDTITKLGFNKTNVGLITGNANFKIYVGQTNDIDFGFNNANWDTVITNYNLIKKYDQNPTSDFITGIGFCQFTMNNKGYVFDTSKGENLIVCVEYNQTDSFINRINWAYDNATNQPGYAMNQTKFWVGNGLTTFSDTTTISNDRHPQMLIVYPKYKNDLQIDAFYGMGKLPKSYVKHDSVMALVSNVGKDTSKGIRVIIRVKGANQFADTFDISNLAPQETKWITLASSSPENTGLDTVYFSFLNDDNSLNDTSTFIRQVNPDVFSYRDITQPPTGGVGFNGQTGDFVAYFSTDSAASINQLTVNLTFTRDSLKMGIWEVDSNTGRPGKNTWTSKTLIPTSATFSALVYPPVSVKGGFYVGVKQIGTINIGFAYQTENPVRPGKFFYTAPSGGTIWTDFSPAAPFRPLIEPRLQMKNDVGPVAISFPKDTIDVSDTTKNYITTEVFNFGSNDQLKKFNIIVKADKYQTIFFRDTLSDTLSSGLRRKYTFKKPLELTEKGPYTLRVYTTLSNDQVIINDTLETNVVAATFNDVLPRNLLGINNGDLIEKWFDTIYTFVNVQNIGSNKTGDFYTHAILTKYNKIIQRDSVLLNIDSESSQIIEFDSMVFQDTGAYVYTVYTSYPKDRNQTFDTIRAKFRVIASHDVRPYEFVLPTDKTNYKVNQLKKFIPEFKIENRGYQPEKDSFNIYYEIHNQDYSKLLFRDTTNNNAIDQYSKKYAFNKIYDVTSRGIYRIRLITDLPIDQIPENDTMDGYFQVGTRLDPAMVSIITPSITDTAELFRTDWAPKVKVTNYGFETTTGVYEVVFEATQNGKIIYTDTQSLSLDSSEIKEVTFKQGLIIPDSGTFEIRSFIHPDQVGFTLNDTLRQTNLCRISYDLKAITLYNKTLVNLKDEQDVKVTIKNIGQKKYDNKFEVNLKYITPGGSSSVTLTQLDTLSAGLTRDYNFKFNPVYGGKYKLIAFVKSIEDQWIYNDTVLGEFNVAILKDVGILNILVPEKDKKYAMSELPFKPSVEIAHLGETPSSLLYNIETTILDSAKNVMLTAFTSGGLNDKEKKTESINKNFNTSYGGKFDIIVVVKSTGDLNDKNDTLRQSFRVAYKSNLNLINKYNLKIVPNPFNHQLKVMGLPSHAIISIYNIEGKKVLSANNNVINTSDLQNGVYTLKIQLPEGSQNIKIIKSK